MTAASGILHEEMHGSEFTRRGGRLEMVQLWVNLPARDKGRPPGYQSILSAQVPEVELPGSAGRGTARVIAGALDGHAGPARTFTPMQVWDARLQGGGRATLPFRDGDNAALFVLRGELALPGGQSVQDAELLLLDRAGTELTVESRADTRFLLLSGEPIDEPVVGYGPFVMNTQAEIRQAIADFQSGKLGTWRK
jgi:redox-sensitive bicupin YhaK (pirin superfamily)